MTDLERIAPDTLRMERLLDAPIETVWQWLVDPQLRQQWFAGGTTPQSGEEFDLLFDHDHLSADPVPYPPQYAQWKGATARERVVRIEPPRLLAFTWDGGKEGIATFELFAVGTQTRLVLTHSGIGGPAECANFGGGWLSHLAVLKAKLSGGTVRDFWALHRTSEAAVAAQLGDAAGAAAAVCLRTPGATEQALRIVRRFDVPPVTVFDALTRPEDMRAWWSGNASFDIDLRVGGQWTIVRRQGGAEYTATGEYLVVERPKLLRYTYAMPQFSANADTIAVEIAAEGGGCVVSFTQSGADIASELAALPPGQTSQSEAGWQQGFDLMASAWTAR
jgi:uncharacterized protein YndB with AHSA1/START domain